MFSVPLIRSGRFNLMAVLRTAVLVLSLFTITIHSGQAEDVPPNIVLNISDDQAWTDYGFG